MLIEDLTIDQVSAALREFLAENEQRGFRGVHRAREHRLAAKQRPLRHAVHAADEYAVFPYFDGVSVAKLMKLVVGGNNIAGYPRPFMAVLRTAFNDLTKRVIEGDAIRGFDMETLHAAAEVKLRWPQHGARIGRPP